MPTVSMLASVADLAASQAAGAISQLMPSGVILPFGGATAPTGWLLCNGATISRTTYAALFSALGTAHGSGDGSTTFHLPDLRGRFVRGTDGGQARDPDRASRTAANTGGNTGDAVGSVQTNATAKNGLGNAASSVTGSVGGSDGTHTHAVGGNSGSLWYGSSIINTAGGGNLYGPTAYSGSVSTTTTSSGHGHAFTQTAAAQTITGDNETRPLNANVNYIIKV